MRHEEGGTTSYSFLVFLQMTFPANTCPTKEFTLQNLVFWSMGYGGWMGVGILPLLWSNTENKGIRAILAILSPTVCSFVMTSLFVVFYMAAQFIWNVGAIMVNPVFLLSSMGAICIAVCSIGMYFALPYYMKPKDDKDSMDSEHEHDGSEVDSQASENESHASTELDAESTDIEPDNSWREQADFEGLRAAPELPA